MPSIAYVTHASIDTGSSLVTSSVDPTANELWLVFVGLRTQTQVATIAGTGLSWSEVGMIANPQNAHRMYVWRGLSTTDPASGAITITVTGNTKPVFCIVAKVTDVDTSGTNGSGAVEVVVPTDGGLVDTADMKVDVTTLTAGSLLVGFGCHRNRVFTVPGGQSAVDATNTLNEQAGAGGDIVGISMWKMDAPTVTTYTLGANGDLHTTTEWSAIGIAIKPAITEVQKTVNDVMSGTDNLSPLTVSASIADLIDATDGFTPSAQLLLSDVLSNIDSLQNTIYMLTQEQTTLIDAHTNTVVFSLNDTTNISDTITNILVSVSVAETLQTLDSAQILNAISIIDNLVGLENINLQYLIQIAEVLIYEESLFNFVQASVTDTTSLSDIHNTLAQISAQDEVAVSDMVNNILSLVAVNDSVITNEQQPIGVSLEITDTLAGEDAVSVMTIIIKTIMETMSTDDSIQISIRANVVEAIIVTESAQSAVTLNISDTINLTDAQLVVFLVSIAESLICIDDLHSPAVSLTINDAVITADTIAQLFNVLQIIEQLTGVDSVVHIDSASKVVKITFTVKSYEQRYELKTHSTTFITKPYNTTFEFVEEV